MCLVGMPNKCVVANCNNESRQFGVTLFSFPKDLERRRQWISFVSKTRVRAPTPDTSKICSAHFDIKYLSNYGAVMAKFGKKMELTSDAVPTIHPQREEECGRSPGSPLMRSAVRKRLVNSVSTISTFHYITNTSPISAYKITQI